MVSKRRTLTSATILILCALALSLAGCGSSDDDDDDSSGAGSGAGGSNAGNGAAGTPSAGGLTIVFSPMYSGFDGVNTYQVPAIVSGVSDAKWSADPADKVDITNDPETGGIMITTNAPGDVKITATAGPLSGSSMLHITEFTPQQRADGEARYNNEIPLPEFMFDPDAGPPTPSSFTIPDNLSCKNCHGSGAMALDVEHTPQQTGGYSDEELIAIFSAGMKPPGGKFKTMVPPFIYTMFHKWGATDAEKKGLVAYLRSLTPMTQGAFDFGGLINRGRAGAGGAGATAGAGGSTP
jgi:hypothetical protein